LQFFAPENWVTVRDALRGVGREDLIGDGPDCLISARPPRRAARSGPGQAVSRSAGQGASRRDDARPGPAGYRRTSRERGQNRREER